MCGIAAALFNADQDEGWARASVAAMLQQTAHRGYSFLNQIAGEDHAVLGCVRLPIRDPLAGVQPAFNVDRTVTVVLNGEVYNAAQLITPPPLRGNSDTALLPYLYRRDSTQPPHVSALLQCRGMFAIILHDKGPREQVFCLRDHVGIKPLFMGECPKGYLFASESKALLGQGLDAIKEVIPGRLLRFEIRNGRWSLASEVDAKAQLRSGATLSVAPEPALLRKTIESVVQRQWPTEDMPVAVLCSGGIDSSVITYELSRLASLHQPLVAYTACCTGPAGISQASDVIAARQLCASLKLPLREVHISHDDIFNELATVIYHTETFEPNVVRNAAIQFCLMRVMAADGFKVAFCGEGADELFWGYADFATAPDPDGLSRDLLLDLHRTQLLRVDRVGMAHTIEVRVPFLDEELVSLALKIPGRDKRLKTCGIWLGKGILRAAYANVLPDEIVLRRKATFAFGAGFGGVEMDDDEMNKRSVTLLQQRRESIEEIERRFPAAFRGHNRTAELALYVSVFAELGFRVPADYAAPTVALRERN